MNKYDDILYLEHEISSKHPKMPISDRAGIFAPFSALSGYEDEIEKVNDDMDKDEKK